MNLVDKPRNRPDFDSLPTQLRALPAVLWTLAPPRKHGAKPVKKPLQRNRRAAKSTDASTWCSFDEAVAAYATRHFDGVGVILDGSGIVCIDLDGCRDVETGELAWWARADMDRFPLAFVELSQSGTGLHIFVRGRLPSGHRKSKDGRREVYETERFIAVTGVEARDAAADLDLDVSESLAAWHAEFIARPIGEAAASSAKPTVATPVMERARRYLEKVAPAVSGQRGRDATFVACMHVVRGFCVDVDAAVGVMSDWNARCSPPWTTRELTRKLKSARDDGGMEWGLHLKTSATSATLPAAPAPKPPPQRPPQGEVDSLWLASASVVEDADVSTWLVSRGVDPGRVADLNLARALSPTALPAWARKVAGGASWHQTGHRLLLPLFDHAGKRRSLKVRSIVDDVDDKDLGPLGFDIRELVMADGSGRCLLRGEADVARLARLGVHAAWITEGVPDFLTAATRFSDAAEDLPGVFGVFSGAWCRAIADRIGDGGGVFVDTHDDDKGAAYAAAIEHTFAGREVCVARRVWSANEGP